VPPLPDPNAVFLNIPYDEEFRDLYIAYIVGLYQLDLVPHLAFEIPGGDRRLNRIFQLIKSCRYSIHDLSRVELSVAPSATPRFNMPLELGMTITWAELHPSRHTCFVWESEPYRLQRSASDLNGTIPAFTTAHRKVFSVNSGTLSTPTIRRPCRKCCIHIRLSFSISTRSY
jgi:hypothetical protein